MSSVKICSVPCESHSVLTFLGCDATHSLCQARREEFCLDRLAAFLMDERVVAVSEYYDLGTSIFAGF